MDTKIAEHIANYLKYEVDAYNADLNTMPLDDLVATIEHAIYFYNQGRLDETEQA